MGSLGETVASLVLGGIIGVGGVAGSNFLGSEELYSHVRSRVGLGTRCDFNVGLGNALACPKGSMEAVKKSTEEAVRHASENLEHVYFSSCKPKVVGTVGEEELDNPNVCEDLEGREMVDFDCDAYLSPFLILYRIAAFNL